MTRTGGDLVADVLLRQGVETIFTLCGGHISPILVASAARGLRVIDTRDEATAVFAADATSRLTGIPGVAAVTAGPGATNTITAVKNAQLAASPLVLLVGATATILRGRGSLQDIDQMALFRPHVSWAASARSVGELVPLVEEAFRRAQHGVPGPVVVECPVDLLYDENVVRQWYGVDAPARGSIGGAVRRWYLQRHLDRLFRDAARSSPAAVPGPPGRQTASDANVARIARWLERAERPVLVVGSQALVAPREASALADAVGSLGMPTFLSGMARGLLGRGHPLQLRHQRKQALREADVVCLAGVPCDFRLDYGRHIAAKATLVTVGRDRHELRKNRRPTLGIEADPDLLLRALASRRVASGRWARWLDLLRARDEAREVEIDERSLTPVDPVNPIWICQEIERHLGDDSVVVADGGDFVATASYIVQPRRPLSWLDPGVFGTLGVGAGFGIGAAAARPDSEIWLLFGDGAVGFSLAEFDTFVRHRLPVIAVVGNDAKWAQIAREQVEILASDVATRLARTDYHRVAEAFGAAGFLIDRPETAGDVFEAAKAVAREGRPVLVNVHLGETDFRKGSISI